MEEQKKNELLERIQRYLTGQLAWLQTKLRSNRTKDLFLLTLPYQVAAMVTALVAVGYAWLFKQMETWNLWLISIHPHLIFIAAPLCFLISWWLVKRYAPMASGSGIPQLMAAIEVANEKKEDRSWRFLNLRIIIIKIASSLAMVLGGGAIGREGPTLQIAGSVYRIVHKLLPPFWPKVSRRVMMITGGAAGLSAAFNTPLGGIVFAVEELTKTHIAQFRTAVLTAVIISGMTAQWVMGPYLFLGYPSVKTVGFSFMYKILVIAVVSGAAGALFCRGALITDRIRRSLKTNFGQGIFVLGCGLIFAGCVSAFGPTVLGSGKHTLETYLFDKEIDPTASNIVARFFGSLVSFSAGGAGGIFAPALSTGAAIGGWIGQWFNPTRDEHNLLILAGMTAFLTGVSRSPFTSAILVLEMTDRHSVIFQLMYAASFGYLIAMAIDRKSYYERMKLRLLQALPLEDQPKPDPDQPRGFGL
ncbi:MAG: chloride channel protein [Flavobacteriales bacterium]|jgi:H+/Cl- antiporter ClcA|nr:chloride channel protein [Flavobacteriales bacterium]MBK6884721.1 chloride channel protein [Flavobacteriales bacterium]MBK7102046.1 chloride channel protein [Flavobacteriales bacterium]MBK7114397.1 chloride channel protein [Flavobacteriales bacterium]MBK7483543.1 chloride channel protein [Flavobacteriales bacterium]